MLREIHKLLQERGTMSLRELCIHFRIEANALEPMMDKLAEKGQVRRIEAGCKLGKDGCKGCTCADREDTIAYVAETRSKESRKYA